MRMMNAISVVLVLASLTARDAVAQWRREPGRPVRWLQRCERADAVRAAVSAKVQRLATAHATLAAPSPVAPPAAREPNVFPDVRYARLEGVDPHLLSLDIHAPHEARDCPVLVYVHGGAWSFGDKLATGHKASYFTGRGWILVSVNYRLLPAADPLVQVQDIARAVAWVHDRIGRYGGSPEDLFLMGHSAGAHLVSLLATDAGWLRQSGKEPSILRGVVQLDTAALDIVHLMETSADYYARFFGDNAGAWRQASPIMHVAAGKPIPPFLLAVAGGHATTRDQVSRFSAALQRAGVRAEIFDAPHKTHTTLNRDLGLADDSVTVVVTEFLESLRAGGS